MNRLIRLAFPLSLLAACGVVQETPDAGIHPDASEYSDGGSSEVDAGPDPDVDPPDTTIESAPSSPSPSASAHFTFSATEPDCTFLCQLDGGVLAACSSPHDLNVSGDGPHELEVRAVDQAGNQDPTPARHAWTVDTRAPVVVVSSGPANPTSASDADLEFTADEEATFDCRLDGGAWQSCSSPRSYSPVGSGAHLFEARATDLAGNQGIGQWSWTVDADAPSIVIDSAPANPTASTSAAFTFTAESGATVACRMDGGGFGACNSATTMSYTGLGANTSHTFRVRATDAAANSAVASYTWTIDTIPPTVTILNTPADPTNLTSASFTFSVDEAATIECRLDAGAWTACASSTSMSYASVAANASHTFRVRATDAAGNQGSDQYTWSVDTAPPDTTITAGPADPYPVDFADFSFDSDDPGASYQCSIDGGGWVACSSPINYTKLGYGSHKLDVRGIDGLGNVETSPATWTWKATPGLILHYKFDGDLRNASALGKRYDGSGSAYEFTDGMVGSAVKLADGELKVPDTRALLSNDTDYTVAMWVAEAQPQTDPVVRYLFSNYASGQTTGGGLAAFRYNSKDYELRWVFAGAGGATGSTQHTFYLGASWKHLVFEHDGSPGKGADVRILVNDAQVAVMSNPDKVVIFGPDQAESLLIGSGSRFMIDDLRVYNRVFTDQEKCEQLLGGLWVSTAPAPYCKF